MIGLEDILDKVVFIQGTRLVKGVENSGDYQKLLDVQPGETGIVLLSGGLDSTVALFLAKHSGLDVCGLEFFYDGRPNVETERIDEICKVADVDCFKIEYPTVFARDPKEKFHLTESNALYYILSGNFAQKHGIKHIVAGQILSDWYGVDAAQAAPGHYRNLNKVLRGEFGDIAPQILTPLIYMNKKQVAKLGFELGAPLDLTWSCFESTVDPCNSCSQCLERNEAMDYISKLK